MKLEELKYDDQVKAIGSRTESQANYLCEVADP